MVAMVIWLPRWTMVAMATQLPRVYHLQSLVLIFWYQPMCFSTCSSQLVAQLLWFIFWELSREVAQIIPTLPSGLFGLLRKITFVFSLNLLANSSGSSFQSALDRVLFPVTSCPTETGFGMKVHVLSIANISPAVWKWITGFCRLNICQNHKTDGKLCK